MSYAKKSNKVVIHSKTKRISKPKQSSASTYQIDSIELQEDLTLKKYTTFTKSQKLSIIADIRKMLWPNATGASSSLTNIVSRLENLNKDRYNQILEHILSVYSPSSLKWKGNKKDWQKYLKQWRRQLKTWIKNIDKPETRGSVRVVPHEKTAEFKQRMIEILQSLPSRNFDLLRETALEALKDILQSEDSQNDDYCAQNLMSENIFSKHFWYDYKRANTDIAELYSKLPICRYNARKKRGSKEAVNENDEEEGEHSPSSISVFFSSSPAQKSEQISPSDNVSTLGGSCTPIDEYQQQYVRFNENSNIFGSDNSWCAFLNLESENRLNEIKIENEYESFDCVNTRFDDYFAISDEVDFDKYRNMLIESQDNEEQKDFFKEFCQHGIDN